MNSHSSAELRRLNRILADESLGPALVKLNKTEQRRVLDLISENRGPLARATIRTLDAARRVKVKIRSRLRRGKVTPPARVPAPVSALMAARRQIEQLMSGTSYRGIETWIRRARYEASEEEMRRIAHASLSEIADQAHVDGLLEVAGMLYYSPFWYHYY